MGLGAEEGQPSGTDWLESLKVEKISWRSINQEDIQGVSQHYALQVVTEMVIRHVHEKD